MLEFSGKELQHTRLPYLLHSDMCQKISDTRQVTNLMKNWYVKSPNVNVSLKIIKKKKALSLYHIDMAKRVIIF